MMEEINNNAAPSQSCRPLKAPQIPLILLVYDPELMMMMIVRMAFMRNEREAEDLRRQTLLVSVRRTLFPLIPI